MTHLNSNWQLHIKFKTVCFIQNVTKGGSRVASDIMPVGKGMGLEQHREALKMIKKLDESTLKTLTIELNKKFAWWDDPENSIEGDIIVSKGSMETSRSYVKELWRLGLLDRFDKNKKKLDLLNDWKYRKPNTIKLSKKGETAIKIKKHFPYYIAWCIVHAVKQGMFPQCDKLFKLYEYEKFIPVNDKETTAKTKEHNIYVEVHANKTIKYGWLESSGLIYRSNRQHFKVNEHFKNHLENIEINNILPDISNNLEHDQFTIVFLPPYLGYSGFKKDKEFDIKVEFKNKTTTELNLKLECIPSRIFQHISEFIIDPVSFIIKPGEIKTINIKLISKSYGVSNSFGQIFCGLLKVILQNTSTILYHLPTIELAKDDRVWEKTVLDKFEKLNLHTDHFGKSDRPDGVIDLQFGIQPDNLLEYLRDEKQEKMLMETTTGVYRWTKRIEDTQTSETRDSKFLRHTTKVLKIKAIGQIIVAEEFQQEGTFDIIEEKRNHIITYVTMKILDYMLSKKKETGNGHAAIISILKSNKIVTMSDVNDAFEEL